MPKDEMVIGGMMRSVKTLCMSFLCLPQDVYKTTRPRDKRIAGCRAWNTKTEMVL